MPITEKLLPSVEQVERIKGLSFNQTWEHIDSSNLLLEVQKKYAQTLNKITFSKFMEDGELDMLPHFLELPLKMVQQPKYNGFCLLETKKGTKELQAIGPNNV
jgi:hypothetical protein